MTPTRSYAKPCIAAALIFGLTACTSESSGSPSPAPETSSAALSTGPSSTGGATINVKACDLLQSAISGQGFDTPQEESFESDNGCGARKSRYGIVTFYLVDNAGINDLDPGKGQDTLVQIAGRDGRQIAGDGREGTCMIGISITAKSRATVGTSLSNGTNEQACSDAKVIAEQIAPKLPKGN
jgi:hypothetical protein